MRRMRDVNVILRKELKKRGFYDITLFPHTRFFRDVYGFDGVCKQNIEGSCSLFLIFWLQLKTGYASKEEKEKLNDFCLHSGEKGLIVEYAPVTKKYKDKKGYYLKERKIIITRLGDVE
jgi:hypothetical protein